MWYSVWIMEDFVRLREVLTPVGVYMLYWQGTVVYVGKSLNIFYRLSTHYNQMLRRLEGKLPYREKGPPILFDDVYVKWVHVDKLDREEIALIQRYQPIHNTRLNRKSYDLSHIPAFAELLKKAKKSPSVLRRSFPRVTPLVVDGFKRASERRRVTVGR